MGGLEPEQVIQILVGDLTDVSVDEVMRFSVWFVLQ